MTDRELAGCAQVMLDDDVAVLTTDAIAYLNGLGTRSSIRMAAAIMQLRSEYAELLSRTPSSEGDGRDGERWRYIAERAPTTIRLDGGMSNPEWAGLCPSYFRGNTADELDAAIDAAIAAAEEGGK